MVNDAWHEHVHPDSVPRLIDNLRTNGETALSGCHLMVERK
jgi:hypothetical protein